MAEPFLELNGIGKAYPGVQALSGVSLSVSPGEVIGLIGENGAGKSTMMKILGGVVAPSMGTIRIDRQDHASLTVKDAIGAGIAFVHQELNLFENLDVASNVYIGREPRYGGPLNLIDRRKLRADVRPLLERVGCDFKPETLVAELSIAQRQQLEIAKALSLGARVVIMDEPTSSLTISETNRLLDIIGDLKASGVAVIFISHRLNEVAHCADRVVVLRDGRMVGTLDRASISHDTMIRLMIGRDLKELYTPPAPAFWTWSICAPRLTRNRRSICRYAAARFSGLPD
jgi:ribose transport system ATP-binding protein